MTKTLTLDPDSDPIPHLSCLRGGGLLLGGPARGGDGARAGGGTRLAWSPTAGLGDGDPERSSDAVGVGLSVEPPASAATLPLPAAARCAGLAAAPPPRAARGGLGLRESLESVPESEPLEEELLSEPEVEPEGLDSESWRRPAAGRRQGAAAAAAARPDGGVALRGAQRSGGAPFAPRGEGERERPRRLGARCCSSSSAASLSRLRASDCAPQRRVKGSRLCWCSLTAQRDCRRLPQTASALQVLREALLPPP